MPCVRSVILIALGAVWVCAAAPPESCAVIKPPDHIFIAPPPYAAMPGRDEFYFGSDDFWTILPKNGVWETQHDKSTYDRRKIVSFSKGYSWLSGMEEDLVVDAKRLDGAGQSVHGGKATNAFMSESQESAMMNYIDFPTTGCWEISARYHSHELKFVVWVMSYTASSN